MSQHAEMEKTEAQRSAQKRFMGNNPLYAMTRREPIQKAAGDTSQAGGAAVNINMRALAQPQTCTAQVRLPGIYCKPRFRMTRFGTANLLPRFFRLVWTERDEAMEEAASGEDG
jgi:hypothetical protein